MRNNGLHFYAIRFYAIMYVLRTYSKRLQWSIHSYMGSESANSQRQRPHFQHSHTNGGNHQPLEAM